MKEYWEGTANVKQFKKWIMQSVITTLYNVLIFLSGTEFIQK